jgi:hypothetical protein
MNINRQKIANLTDDQIESIIKGELDVGIRMGFELEFQKLNGKKTEEFKHKCNCNGKVDMDAVNTAALELLDSHTATYYRAHFASNTSGKSFAFKAVNEVVATLPDTFTKVDLLRALGAKAPRTKWKAIGVFLDKLDETLCAKAAEGIDKSKHIIRDCRCTDKSSWGAMCKTLKVNDQLHVKQDSSVSGGEITTKGPNTVAQCLSLTDFIFSNNDLSIDKGCSYHLHFSVEGMNHSYGSHIQSEAMRFLHEQLKQGKWGDFLEKRLNNMQHYRPKIDSDKYTLLNFNGEYNTWEFRIFGNVSNTADAADCFRLAIRSMRHVYQVLEGMKPSLRQDIAKATGVTPSKVRITDFFHQYGDDLFDARPSKPNLQAIIESFSAKIATSIDLDTDQVA